MHVFRAKSEGRGRAHTVSKGNRNNKGELDTKIKIKQYRRSCQQRAVPTVPQGHPARGQPGSARPPAGGPESPRGLAPCFPKLSEQSSCLQDSQGLPGLVNNSWTSFEGQGVVPRESPRGCWSHLSAGHSGCVPGQPGSVPGSGVTARSAASGHHMELRREALCSLRSKGCEARVPAPCPPGHQEHPGQREAAA